MSEEMKAEALRGVELKAYDVRAARAELEGRISARDAAIAEALANGVSQITIAAAATVSQATVSRIDRARKTAAAAL